MFIMNITLQTCPKAHGHISGADLLNWLAFVVMVLFIYATAAKLQRIQFVSLVRSIVFVISSHEHT